MCPHFLASLDEQDEHLCRKIFYGKSKKALLVQVILKTDPLIIRLLEIFLNVKISLDGYD